MLFAACDPSTAQQRDDVPDVAPMTPRVKVLLPLRLTLGVCIEGFIWGICVLYHRRYVVAHLIRIVELRVEVPIYVLL